MRFTVCEISSGGVSAVVTVLLVLMQKINYVNTEIGLQLLTEEPFYLGDQISYRCTLNGLTYPIKLGLIIRAGNEKLLESGCTFNPITSSWEEHNTGVVSDSFQTESCNQIPKPSMTVINSVDVTVTGTITNSLLNSNSTCSAQYFSDGLLGTLSNNHQIIPYVYSPPKDITMQVLFEIDGLPVLGRWAFVKCISLDSQPESQYSYDVLTSSGSTTVSSEAIEGVNLTINENYINGFEIECKDIIHATRGVNVVYKSSSYHPNYVKIPGRSQQNVTVDKSTGSTILRCEVEAHDATNYTSGNVVSYVWRRNNSIITENTDRLVVQYDGVNDAEMITCTASVPYYSARITWYLLWSTQPNGPETINDAPPTNYFNTNLLLALLLPILALALLICFLIYLFKVRKLKIKKFPNNKSFTGEQKHDNPHDNTHDNPHDTMQNETVSDHRTSLSNDSSYYYPTSMMNNQKTNGLDSSLYATPHFDEKYRRNRNSGRGYERSRLDYGGNLSDRQYSDNSHKSQNYNYNAYGYPEAQPVSKAYMPVKV